MIGCYPDINFGMPGLKGRRLTVFDIVTQVYYEDSVKLALDAYEITLEDANDATEYCMNLKCKTDKDLVQYCDGCILRTFAEGWNFNKDDYTQVSDGLVVSTDQKIFSTGTVQELEDSMFGKVTWLMAEKVYQMLLDFKK